MLKPGLTLAAAVMAADQFSKWWAIEAMRPEGVAETPFRSLHAIAVTPFFDLVMTWNRGFSFGMFNNDGAYNAIVLSLLALIVSGLLVAWLRKAEDRLQMVSLGLIIGGALGNVIDRVRFGAVADFLSFHVASYYWPAFNVADSAITVGAVLLGYDALFRKHGSKNPPT